jgi:hypothetical protein
MPDLGTLAEAHILAVGDGLKVFSESPHIRLEIHPQEFTASGEFSTHVGNQILIPHTLGVLGLDSIPREGQSSYIEAFPARRLIGRKKFRFKYK